MTILPTMTITIMLLIYLLSGVTRNTTQDTTYPRHSATRIIDNGGLPTISQRSSHSRPPRQPAPTDTYRHTRHTHTQTHTEMWLNTPNQTTHIENTTWCRLIASRINKPNVWHQHDVIESVSTVTHVSKAVNCSLSMHLSSATMLG